MASEREAIADIMVDFRQYVENTKVQPEVAETICCYLDRIEAAWKRERGNAAAMRERETVTDCNRLGNAAAMREALETALPIMRNSPFTHYNTTEVDAVVEMMERALAAPPRNCDGGTPEEQAKRYARYCDTHLRDDGSRPCTDCPCCGRIPFGKCEFAWAQMPYDAMKGGAE